MASVSLISVTPVKSTRLRHPPEVRLERFGVAENRRFYLVNEAGRLFNASRHGPLIALRTSYDRRDECLEIAFPDGRVVVERVHVAGPAVQTNFWGRPVTGREVTGPWSEALSQYAGRPVRLIRAERPGGGVDAYAASIVSVASLEELARRSGAGRVDGRRFRMLFEVDGTEPHEEDTWVGRDVRFGEALLRVIRPDPRCVITTKDPDTGQPDFRTLDEVKRYRGLREGKHIDFGVYADVVEPGTVRLGDPVEVLP